MTIYGLTSPIIIYAFYLPAIQPVGWAITIGTVLTLLIVLFVSGGIILMYRDPGELLKKQIVPEEHALFCTVCQINVYFNLM